MRKHFSSSTAISSVTRSNRDLEVQSDMIARKVTSEVSPALIREVNPGMIGDGISNIAKQHDLIVNLGNQWIMRNRGNVIMRKNYTSTIMQLAAKLKIACQKLSQTSLDYAPKYFEIVLKLLCLAAIFMIWRRT